MKAPLDGWTLPLIVTWRPLAKPLVAPPAILEVVSKQAGPLPILPEWKVLPSATVNSVGLQRPEQGVAMVVARQSERHCESPMGRPGPNAPCFPFPICPRHALSSPAWPRPRHCWARGRLFPCQNCLSCPHAVIGSVFQSDGVTSGVCPASD